MTTEPTPIPQMNQDLMPDSPLSPQTTASITKDSLTIESPSNMEEPLEIPQAIDNVPPAEPSFFGTLTTEEPFSEEGVVMRPLPPPRREETIMNDADSGFRSLFPTNPRPVSSLRSQIITDSVIPSQRVRFFLKSL
jgi:hypothetical protein